MRPPSTSSTGSRGRWACSVCTASCEVRHEKLKKPWVGSGSTAIWCNCNPVMRECLHGENVISFFFHCASSLSWKTKLSCSTMVYLWKLFRKWLLAFLCSDELFSFFMCWCLSSCGSSGRTAEKTSVNFKSDQVRVKQEPGTEEEICSFSGTVKQEKTEDGRRSACMVKLVCAAVSYPFPSSIWLSIWK